MAAYEKRNLREVENMALAFGLEGMDSRFPKRELGSELGAVSLHRLDPGVRQPFGHRHERQEEHYVVVDGSGRINVGGEVVELAPWDVIRVPAGRDARVRGRAGRARVPRVRRAARRVADGADRTRLVGLEKDVEHEPVLDLAHHLEAALLEHA